VEEHRLRQDLAESHQLPNPGNYVADPSDVGGYLGDNQGVVWVVFDPTSSSPGHVTKDIYVGVADKQNTVYRSTDGGQTWERIPGQPTGFLAQKGVFDHVNGLLYIATSDTGGPYDGSDGEVWRYDTTTGTWTDITPADPDGFEYGFSGLTIDRQNPDTIMVVSQILWCPTSKSGVPPTAEKPGAASGSSADTPTAPCATTTTSPRPRGWTSTGRTTRPKSAPSSVG